jgi:hypothetical protein
MKTLFLSSSLMLIWITGVTACDYCNSYLSLNPGYNRNSVGIRSGLRLASWEPLYEGARIQHGGTGTPGEGNGEHLEESFITLDVCARYYPLPELQLIGFMPLTMNTLSFDGTTTTRTAPGDAQLLALYQVANTKPGDSAGIRHRFFAGAGIKFPTGTSEDPEDVDLPMAHHLYSGTGSTDFLVMATYFGKRGKLGWNLDASYKINGSSSNDYRYGNTFNATPRVFYEFGSAKVKMLPHAGLPFEQAAGDEFEGKDQPETGGSVLWGAAGFDIYFGSFSVTTEARLPVVSDVGRMISEDYFALYLSFNFHF